MSLLDSFRIRKSHMQDVPAAVEESPRQGEVTWDFKSPNFHALQRRSKTIRSRREKPTPRLRDDDAIVEFAKKLREEPSLSVRRIAVSEITPKNREERAGFAETTLQRSRRAKRAYTELLKLEEELGIGAETEKKTSEQSGDEIDRLCSGLDLDQWEEEKPSSTTPPHNTPSTRKGLSTEKAPYNVVGEEKGEGRCSSADIERKRRLAMQRKMKRLFQEKLKRKQQNGFK